MLGPELIQGTCDNVLIIRESMSTTQSRQKSYADDQMRPLEFDVGDYVFLKVSPVRGLEKGGSSAPNLSDCLKSPREVGRLAY
jgi:hypothetical protein